MSFSDITNLFTFIGGLGMFLYGMHEMSSGIQKSAGSKMQDLLGILTNNRLVAVLVGAGITAIIQSSAATTVMAVGFVNAGIMTLGQAVGIVMGANIGTCITAWIVSLEQVGSSFSALSPSLYAPLLIGVGAFLVMFSQKPKKQIYGEIMIGLGLLFVGLNFMGSSAKAYMGSPVVTNAFLLFGDNPFLGIATGAVITAIMQSSSASVGVLQTLAATSGAVSVSAAVYISLGSNIGTCITAILSSFGTTRNAKRVAAMHLIYNVIGAVVFGVLSYIGFSFFRDFSHQSIDSVGISLFHTGFKVACTVMLFPFAKQLISISGLLVKGEDEPEAAENEETVTLRHLDKRILKSPDFAVENAIKEVVHMGEITAENLRDACKVVMNYDEELLKKIYAAEKTINAMEKLITQYLVDINNLSLTVKQHEIIKNLFYSVSDIERVGDHTENIAEIMDAKRTGEPVVFSEEAKGEMAEMMGLVKDAFRCSINARREVSIEDAVLVGKFEEKVDDMEEELREKHIERLSKQLCDPANGVAFLDILSNLERISDHAYNLAGYVMSEHE